MIANNPACAVDAPSAIRNTREPFTIEELKALLIVSDQNWKVLILLGAYAGLRLGDACSLTWQNVDLDMRTITYLPKKKSRLPNVKKVVVPIHSDLYEAILKLPVTSNSPTTQLVSNLGSHATSGRNGLSMKFNRLMKMAGIDSLAIKAKGQRTFQAKTFHSLRHTFVSLMANSGVSQELRKELAGHDSDVHRIYSHHSIASFRGAIESMPSIVTK
jgi:integrase